MSALKELPFHEISNFQLCSEFESVRTKFENLLTENRFTKTLQDTFSSEVTNTFKCKYYDNTSFNNMIKDSKHDIGLSVFHINLQSSFKNFAHLLAEITTLNHDFDVITISETGKKNLCLCTNLFENYSFFYKEPTSHKGGVGMYIKNDIDILAREELTIEPESTESIWLEL